MCEPVFARQCSCCSKEYGPTLWLQDDSEVGEEVFVYPCERCREVQAGAHPSICGGRKVLFVALSRAARAGGVGYLLPQVLREKVTSLPVVSGRCA